MRKPHTASLNLIKHRANKNNVFFNVNYYDKIRTLNFSTFYRDAQSYHHAMGLAQSVVRREGMTTNKGKGRRYLKQIIAWADKNRVSVSLFTTSYKLMKYYISLGFTVVKKNTLKQTMDDLKRGFTTYFIYHPKPTLP